ncbi:hypothetical protein BU23DRAFT_40102 [Bimuria novae-zelandiae CBS 107.79]|uniref:Uncharacterized protein n=1 Tax=Bimuria novae-zelandiae CBS 107.79 TaxID=1447943 RepID=A0A6A5UPX9_9PLEO|nr:hypothetical protein BU23DRAFT_40102 [Bimuria novae-zelandiae CBS 107.79]
MTVGKQPGCRASLIVWSNIPLASRVACELRKVHHTFWKPKTELCTTNSTLVPRRMLGSRAATPCPTPSRREGFTTTNCTTPLARQLPTLCTKCLDRTNPDNAVNSVNNHCVIFPSSEDTLRFWRFVRGSRPCVIGRTCKASFNSVTTQQMPSCCPTSLSPFSKG